MSARIKDRVVRLGRPGPAQVIDFAVARRQSAAALQRRLLREFLIPNSAHAVARSPYWRQAFREPVAGVLNGLKAQGLLVEPDDPRARLCCGRDESDLRLLCLDNGLFPAGGVAELADRLLTIDPSGWLLGYPGELLQCSEFAARTAAKRGNAAIPAAQGRCVTTSTDNDPIWELLKVQAQQTARDGNLAQCRNLHLAMANHLLRRNEPARALQALCIVCVFDLCGVRNRSDAPAELRKSHSRFDASRASLAPWLETRISELCCDMRLSLDEMRETFLQVGTRLPLPQDPQKLWAVLRLALEGAFDAQDDTRRNRAIRKALDD